MKKVITVKFKLNCRQCAIEQDATGYKWYYVENMERPLEPNFVSDELRIAGENALEEEGA